MYLVEKPGKKSKFLSAAPWIARITRAVERKWTPTRLSLVPGGKREEKKP